MKPTQPPLVTTEHATLFVVPCSASKNTMAGREIAAENTYTGQAFKLARNQLKAAGAKWCILSARYGFLWPSTRIEWYDTKLTEADVQGIESMDAPWYPFELLTQRQYARLCTAPTIVTLGSALYARAVKGLVEGYAHHPDLGRTYHAPFAGLPIGRMLQGIKLGMWHTKCPCCAMPTHTPFDHLDIDCSHP